MVIRHNTGGMLNDKEIPVKSGSIVYADFNRNFVYPNEVKVGGGEVLFGRVELKSTLISAKKAFSSKTRMMKCKNNGGHVAEFNFRHCLTKDGDNSSRKDTFIKMMADNAEPTVTPTVTIITTTTTTTCHCYHRNNHHLSL